MKLRPDDAEPARGGSGDAGLLILRGSIVGLSPPSARKYNSSGRVELEAILEVEQRKAGEDQGRAGRLQMFIS